MAFMEEMSFLFLFLEEMSFLSRTFVAEIKSLSLQEPIF